MATADAYLGILAIDPAGQVHSRVVPNVVLRGGRALFDRLAVFPRLARHSPVDNPVQSWCAVQYREPIHLPSPAAAWADGRLRIGRLISGILVGEPGGSPRSHSAFPADIRRLIFRDGRPVNSALSAMPFGSAAATRSVRTS